MAKRKEEKPPAPDFSDDLAATICSHIATGKALDVASVLTHPSLTPDVVFLWMYRSVAFSALYRTAKQTAMMKYLEDTIEIADDASGDTYEDVTKDGDKVDKPNSANVNRAKLKVETRKWAMQALSRDIFGDVKAGGGSDGGETTIKIVGGLPDE